MPTPLTDTTSLLEWRAAARADHERSARWYLIAGILALSMIVYGVLSGSWTMSVAVAVASGLYFLVRNEKHPVHTIRIFQAGIELDGRFSAWSQWQHFWILLGAGYTELHIAPKSSFRSEFTIQTGEIDPETLRDVLSQFLPQVERREGVLDAIVRYCKL